MWREPFLLPIYRIHDDASPYIPSPWTMRPMRPRWVPTPAAANSCCCYYPPHVCVPMSGVGHIGQGRIVQETHRPRDVWTHPHGIQRTHLTLPSSFPLQFSLWKWKTIFRGFLFFILTYICKSLRNFPCYSQPSLLTDFRFHIGSHETSPIIWIGKSAPSV